MSCLGLSRDSFYCDSVVSANDFIGNALNYSLPTLSTCVTDYVSFSLSLSLSQSVSYSQSKRSTSRSSQEEFSVLQWM